VEVERLTVKIMITGEFMKRILFKGKASALVDWLKSESYLNKGWSLSFYIDTLASSEERRSKVLAGNKKGQTSRTATL